MKELYYKNITYIQEYINNNKSWEDIEKALELNVFHTTFTFPEDMDESFVNHVRAESSLLEKYLGKELTEKIYRKKREFNAKNTLEVKQLKLQKAADTFSVSLLQKVVESERPFGLDMALVENLIVKYGGENFSLEKLDHYFGLLEEYTLDGSIRFEDKDYSTKKDLLDAVFNSLKKQILEVSTDLNNILDTRQVRAKLQSVVNSKSTFNIILRDEISKTFKEKGKMFVEYDNIYYVLSDRNQISLFLNAFYRKVASRI